MKGEQNVRTILESECFSSDLVVHMQFVQFPHAHSMVAAILSAGDMDCTEGSSVVRHIVVISGACISALEKSPARHKIERGQ